jgi:hypothetical protein
VDWIYALKEETGSATWYALPPHPLVASWFIPHCYIGPTGTMLSRFCPSVGIARAPSRSKRLVTSGAVFVIGRAYLAGPTTAAAPRRRAARDVVLERVRQVGPNKAGAKAIRSIASRCVQAMNGAACFVPAAKSRSTTVAVRASKR